MNVVALGMTPREAKFLEQLLRRVGGSYEGPRGMADRLLNRVSSELEYLYENGKIKERQSAEFEFTGSIYVEKKEK